MFYLAGRVSKPQELLVLLNTLHTADLVLILKNVLFLLTSTVVMNLSSFFFFSMDIQLLIISLSGIWVCVRAFFWAVGEGNLFLI